MTEDGSAPARALRPGSDARSPRENTVAALRALFERARRANYVLESPAADLHKPRRLTSRRRGLDERELAETIEAVRMTSRDIELDQVEDALADLDEAPWTAKARAMAAQQATLQTRPSKHGEEQDPHERWRAEARVRGWDPDQLIADIAPEPGPEPGLPSTVAETGTETDVDVEDVLDRAVARLEDNQATWRRGNLVRAVAEALPPAARTADAAAALVDELVAAAEGSGGLVAIAAPEPAPVPAELCRRDGTSVYRPAAATRYTTPGVLRASAPATSPS